ncbi:hypothetical protein H6P81_007683 [Aristolochia fimbriata]|uniref:Uncharacterized protein n=1 Tax=Aristolochia fimbriata TaxID=158543 RepID=A0AAV7F289_ARIFI|nr:hypothetical protein H6P81_007683 [Aristolochia fimbriata]
MLCKNDLLRYALQERPASVCSARTTCFGALCKNDLLRYALQERPASVCSARTSCFDNSTTFLSFLPWLAPAMIRARWDSFELIAMLGKLNGGAAREIPHVLCMVMGKKESEVM